MGLPTDNEKTLREFLLGALPPAERDAIEDRFMVEDDLFAALNAVEEELLEEYARGELSAPERERVERHLLMSPRNQKRARLLRTMQAAFERPPTTTSPEPQTIFRRMFGPGFGRYALLAASCLILVLGLGWWWMRGRDEVSLQADKGAPPDLTVPRNTPQPVSPTPEPTTDAPSPAPDANPSSVNPSSKAPKETTPRRPAPQPVIATLTLSAVAMRSEGRVPELSLPATARAAQFKLLLETDDYARYRAVLTDEDGAPIWKSGPLKARAQAVKLNIPGRVLREGDYFLRLMGLDANTSAPVAEYSFRIRQP